MNLNGDAANSEWLLVQRTGCEPDVRLFCIPYAGGGASSFMSWARALKPGVELLAVQPPGREHRFGTPPIEVFDDLLDALEAVLLPLLDVPFVLLGCSVGGLVAFELGRRLQARGGPEPMGLIMAATPPPHRSSARPQLTHLDDRALFEEVQRRYGGVPQEVFQDAELRTLFALPLRADLRLLESYQFDESRAPFRGPVTIFGGTTDPELPTPVLNEWQQFIDGPFQPRRLPGGHFFFRERRDELAREVAAVVDEYYTAKGQMTWPAT